MYYADLCLRAKRERRCELRALRFAANTTDPHARRLACHKAVQSSQWQAHLQHLLCRADGRLA